MADLERLGDDAAMRLLEPPGRVQLYGSYASLELAEARIEAPAEEPLGKYLTVKFHTPTLLQYPKPPRVRAPSVNALYPQPRLLVLNLLQRARHYGVEAPLSLYVYAPFDLVESTHSIRPAAVYVGPHHAVGFAGVITYRVEAPERRRQWLSKLLGLAKYIGVGRATSMGFGWVELQSHNG
ncbi:CRISPR system precrRNA processing endoribonuclease RAMP protein Cas6 [Pyrobaculum aerophilum]|uniref:CRISPR system precrRNA processing endoribonuclease RAMP protein Cas6 n=1 Tax=Pyrobaculum aerophilum TaxID=13773 RepID=UPI0023F2B1C3|nr:CRISPR system precrRNA processing endoribonuclease RAMP protein Cas6 [Pyrobaculum aerophilum]MCX8138014.1 CRISPR system precrRNA processing endoribonuclease RAMP protein Cas6 [Pyrobaculum aerophilum]